MFFPSWSEMICGCPAVAARVGCNATRGDAGSREDQEDVSGATTGAPRGDARILLVLAAGILFGAMAGSALPVALPHIGRDLQLGLGGASWIMLAYFLASTTLLVIAGRLGDWLGHRSIYLAGGLILMAGSAVCAVAGDLVSIAAGRLIQGAAGALGMAVVPALVSTNVAPERRGRAFGIVSTGTYIGLTAGPPLGGGMVQAFGWRSLFVVMIGVGLFMFASGSRALPRRQGAGRPFKDIPGALLMLLGFPFSIVAVSRGHAWGWTSAPTLVTAAVGLGAFAWFLVREWGREDALVDLNLFRSRKFTGAALAALFNYIALFIPIILMPYYLVEALGMSAAATGALLSSQPAVMALVASPAGALSDRIGARGLAVVGMSLLAVGLWGLSGVDADSSTLSIGLWYALAGFGVGIFVSPNTSAAMGAAPDEQQGLAGGLLALCRVFGMLLGIAAATTIFESAGGQTGGTWGPTEFGALQLALRIAAAHALAAAVTSALRGRHEA